MIHDKDRSGWFGASDTARIMGHWDTKTFRIWWLEKMGLRHSDFSSLAMQTGTALEHRILEEYGIARMDRQIRIPRLRLRVNLDGETRGRILEVKTHGGSNFKVSKPYWMQTQVERYAGRKPVTILAYKLEPEDYHNWFRPIDRNRLAEYPIEYDAEWIERQYLPRLEYLAWCLKKGAYPDEMQFG